MDAMPVDDMDICPMCRGDGTIKLHCDDPPDRCATCRFWFTQGNEHHPEWGSCHKLPPIVIPGADAPEWPCPTADEWCGAHEVSEYRVGHDRAFGRRLSEDQAERRAENTEKG